MFQSLPIPFFSLCLAFLLLLINLSVLILKCIFQFFGGPSCLSVTRANTDVERIEMCCILHSILHGDVFGFCTGQCILLSRHTAQNLITLLALRPHKPESNQAGAYRRHHRQKSYHANDFGRFQPSGGSWFDTRDRVRAGRIHLIKQTFLLLHALCKARKLVLFPIW